MFSKNRFLQSRYMGFFFIIISIALFLVFQLYIVKTASIKLPNGNYSEYFELVSSSKIYFYGILVIVFIGGIINLVVPPKPKEKIDKTEDAGSNK